MWFTAISTSFDCHVRLSSRSVIGKTINFLPALYFPIRHSLMLDKVSLCRLLQCNSTTLGNICYTLFLLSCLVLFRFRQVLSIHCNFLFCVVYIFSFFCICTIHICTPASCCLRFVIKGTFEPALSGLYF